MAIAPIPIRLRVNGVDHEAAVPPRMLLSDFIRHDLRLTGTHVGCEHGVCGACTILLDDRAVRACLMFAVQADGCDVRTVESLTRADDSLTAIPQAFRDEHGLQCGFCTPGIMMSLASLVGEPEIRPGDVIDAVAGHLCRCTGYRNIVRAAERGLGVAVPTADIATGDEFTSDSVR